MTNDIDVLKAEIERLRGLVMRGREVVKAQEDLLIAYRVGKQPKEKSLDVLQDKAAWLKESEGGDAID